MPDVPPTIQRVTGKVVRAEWVDPADTTPNATRAPRLVNGHRAFCPLRRCRARHGDATFTDEHVQTADKLRSLFDGARLGFAGLQDWRPVHSRIYRPMQGPDVRAMKQLRCRQAFDRAWSLFDPQTRAVVRLVVLEHLGTTIAAESLGLTRALAIQRLVEALDRLCLHFDIRDARKAA
jgi:hypothetical protein